MFKNERVDNEDMVYIPNRVYFASGNGLQYYMWNKLFRKHIFNP